MTPWTSFFPWVNDYFPSWVQSFFGVFIATLLVIVPLLTIFVYLSRKISADIHARIGPAVVGPAGMFQPVADLLKILQRHTVVKEAPLAPLIWFYLRWMIFFSTIAIIPLGFAASIFNSELGILFFFWIVLAAMLATMFVGISHGSAQGWFLGMQIWAQAVAGAFPASVTIVCAALHSGSFQWTMVVDQQGFSPLYWSAFSNPFQFISFLVFLSSGVALVGLSNILDGVFVYNDYGKGMRIILSKLLYCYSIFLWSIMAVILYLGAWNLPPRLISAATYIGGNPAVNITQLGCLFIKCFFLMLVMVFLNNALPRRRSDQITYYCWRILGPLSLLALFGEGVINIGGMLK